MDIVMVMNDKIMDANRGDAGEEVVDWVHTGCFFLKIGKKSRKQLSSTNAITNNTSTNRQEYMNMQLALQTTSGARSYMLTTITGIFPIKGQPAT